jgi:hypothetical protein
VSGSELEPASANLRAEVDEQYLVVSVQISSRLHPELFRAFDLIKKRDRAERARLLCLYGLREESTALSRSSGQTIPPDNIGRRSPIDAGQPLTEAASTTGIDLSPTAPRQAIKNLVDESQDIDKWFL